MMTVITTTSQHLSNLCVCVQKREKLRKNQNVKGAIALRALSINYEWLTMSKIRQVVSFLPPFTIVDKTTSLLFWVDKGELSQSQPRTGDFWLKYQARQPFSFVNLVTASSHSTDYRPAILPSPLIFFILTIKQAIHLPSLSLASLAASDSVKKEGKESSIILSCSLTLMV